MAVGSAGSALQGMPGVGSHKGSPGYSELSHGVWTERDAAPLDGREANQGAGEANPSLCWREEWVQSLDRAQGGDVRVIVNSLCKQLSSECTQLSSGRGAAHPGRLKSRVPADDSEPGSLCPLPPCSTAVLPRGPSTPAALTHSLPCTLPGVPWGREMGFAFPGGVCCSWRVLGQVGSWAHLHAAPGSAAAGCSDTLGHAPQAAQLFWDLSTSPALHG